MREGDLLIQGTQVTGFLSEIYNENSCTVAVYKSAYDITENYRLLNNFWRHVRFETPTSKVL